MGEREGGRSEAEGTGPVKAPASKRSGRLSRGQVNDLCHAVLASQNYLRALEHAVAQLARMLEVINDSMTIETVRKVTDDHLDIPEELWSNVLDDPPPHAADGADNRRGEHEATPNRPSARTKAQLSFHDRR